MQQPFYFEPALGNLRSYLGEISEGFLSAENKNSIYSAATRLLREREDVAYFLNKFNSFLFYCTKKIKGGEGRSLLEEVGLRTLHELFEWIVQFPQVMLAFPDDRYLSYAPLFLRYLSFLIEAFRDEALLPLGESRNALVKGLMLGKPKRLSQIKYADLRPFFVQLNEKSLLTLLAVRVLVRAASLKTREQNRISVLELLTNIFLDRDQLGAVENFLVWFSENQGDRGSEQAKKIEKTKKYLLIWLSKKDESERKAAFVALSKYHHFFERGLGFGHSKRRVKTYINFLLALDSIPEFQDFLGQHSDFFEIISYTSIVEWAMGRQDEREIFETLKALCKIWEKPGIAQQKLEQHINLFFLTDSSRYALNCSSYPPLFFRMLEHCRLFEIDLFSRGEGVSPEFLLLGLVFFGGERQDERDYEEVLNTVKRDKESQQRIQNFLTSPGLEEEISNFNKIFLEHQIAGDEQPFPPCIKRVYQFFQEFNQAEIFEEACISKREHLFFTNQVFELFRSAGRERIFVGACVGYELQAAEHAVSVLEKPMSEDATPSVIEASLWKPKPFPLLVLESFVLEAARVRTLPFS